MGSHDYYSKPPWRKGKHSCLVHASDGKGPVAHTKGFSRKENEANAHVIATAPKLFEGLRAFRDRYETLLEEGAIAVLGDDELAQSVRVTGVDVDALRAHPDSAWKVADDRPRVITADDKTVATIALLPNSPCEMHANAALIAAAPELLAAYRGVVETFARPDEQERRRAWEMCKQAIFKAEYQP